MRKTGTDPLLISMQWAKLQSVVDEARVTSDRDGRTVELALRLQGGEDGE